MKTSTLVRFALAAVCCTPLVAAAAPGSREALSYTLGEVRLLAEDPDGGDDADGIRVGGSVLVHQDFFVTGALSSLSGDGPNGRDTDLFEAGLGLRYPVSPRVDLLGIAGFVRMDRDTRGAGDDDDVGPSLTGGARLALTPLVEFAGYLNYVELFGDGDLALRGEGLYHLTPNLSLLAGLGVSDDTREASLGARWNFTPTR
jgi:hypothetical protein